MLSACWLTGAYFLAVSSHKHGRLNTSVYGTLQTYHRGGASKASVATLTGDVDGSSRYMYDTCIKPLGQLLHAHAQMVLSQQILKFILLGKEKKISCSGVDSNLGLMHCRPLPLPLS